MRNARIAVALLGLVSASRFAHADGDRGSWWCLRGDGAPCGQQELFDTVRYKQVLVLPAGFEPSERGTFLSEFERLVDNLGSAPAPVYTARHASRLVYFGYWLSGGALGTPSAMFGARVADHPIRGKALTLSQDSVVDWTRFFGGTVVPGVKPWAVLVLFNSMEEEVTANAAPPNFLGQSFGIAKFNRADLASPYIPTHELAHASLSFLDEYVEHGMENLNLKSLDIITPLTLIDGSWGGWVQAISNLFGVYEYRISEILAANGNDNIDVTKYPARVATPGFSPNEYEYEGGFFFGRGTYHDRGSNLMNSSTVVNGPDDQFAYDHSGSQRAVIRSIFEAGGAAGRPNDRIRAAGPKTGWPSQWGADSRVMLYDADKLHSVHPTRAYDVQVGWYDRQWDTCWKWKVIPYPCYQDVWQTAQRTVAPAQRTLSLKMTALYSLAKMTSQLLCQLGVDEIKSGSGSFKLCTQSLDEIADAFVPTVVFRVPYQDVSVPTRQWFTTYHWRFRTNNGSHTSGWTGWSSFYRYL